MCTPILLSKFFFNMINDLGAKNDTILLSIFFQSDTRFEVWNVHPYTTVKIFFFNSFLNFFLIKILFLKTFQLTLEIYYCKILLKSTQNIKMLNNRFRGLEKNLIGWWMNNMVCHWLLWCIDSSWTSCKRKAEKKISIQVHNIPSNLYRL